jgi:hypothetical protein
MKPIAAGMFLAIVAVLWTVPGVSAKCETLYAEVQARIRQAEADGQDPMLLGQARRCADEGMKRHSQNRHWESMTTFRRCLKILDG